MITYTNRQRITKPQQLSSSQRTLYTESSFISQYLSHEKGIFDLKRNCSQQFSEEKKFQKTFQKTGFQKSYIQSKYLLIQDRSKKQRDGWRKYLIQNFKLQIEDFMHQNSKLIIRKSSLAKRNTNLEIGNQIKNDYLAINEIIRKSNTGISMQQVQKNIIYQNKDYLLKNTKVDYDEKLSKVAQQFEIIIDRIERETFKMVLPSNFSAAMSNYNDYYTINLEDKQIPRNLKTKNFILTDRKLKKKENLYNLFEQQYVDEVQVCSSRIIESVEQEQLIFQTNELIDHMPFEKVSEADNQLCDQNSVPLEIQQENAIQKSQKQLKSKVQKTGIKYTYIEFLLNQENIFDANLDQYIKPKIFHNYDTYEFVDREEERIYKIQCDWNDLIQ